MKTEKLYADGWDDWFDHGKLFSKRTEIRKTNTSTTRYYFIFNSFDNEIEFISEAAETILGYKREEISLLKLMSSIHPEDADYCMACEYKVIEFMNLLYFEEHYRFYTQYSYRIKKSDGSYVYIRQSYHAIEMNEVGHMYKSIVYHDVIDENYIRNDNDFQIIDRWKSSPIQINNMYNLSKRETEVLNLIMQGKNSKEIAEITFISEHTVNTHRRNILSKTNSSNFLSLLQKIKTI